jgi:hypothetical protein
MHFLLTFDVFFMNISHVVNFNVNYYVNELIHYGYDHGYGYDSF